MNELGDDDLANLHKALRVAIEHGGVHTGEIIGHRRAGDHCPGAARRWRTAVDWWCAKEQA